MFRPIRVVLALLCSSVFAHGQALPYVPRAVAAYVSPGGTGAAGTWYAMAGTGNSPLTYVPGAQGLYVSTDGSGNAGTWVPWTGSSGGAPTTCASGNNYACLNTANAFTSNQSTVSGTATTPTSYTVTTSDTETASSAFVSGVIAANAMEVNQIFGKDIGNGLGAAQLTFHYQCNGCGGNYYSIGFINGFNTGNPHLRVWATGEVSANESSLTGFDFAAPKVGADAYNTLTNCSSTASPAVCGSAAAGKVQLAASATSLQINTSAITANSECHYTYSVAGITAPANMASLLQPYESARTAGTSLTITLPVAPTTNPVNVMYFCIN